MKTCIGINLLGKRMSEGIIDTGSSYLRRKKTTTRKQPKLCKPNNKNVHLNHEKVYA